MRKLFLSTSVLLLVGFFVANVASVAKAQSTTSPAVSPPVGAGCVRAGCSGEVCVPTGTDDFMTICIYRPEFACYQQATCERQTNGQCGFTITAQVQACLNEVRPSPSVSPSSSPLPAGNVSWATPYASLQANQFTIVTPNGAFIGSSNNLQVSSDPGSDNYTTLETFWQERGVEMRVFIYFAQTNGQWRVTELRTYNGNSRGDWIYYDGAAFGTQAVGQSIVKNNFTLTSRDGGSRVIFGSMDLQAFLPHPSPSISPAGFYIEPKPYGTVEFGVSGPNSGYNIMAVVRNSQGQIVTDQSDFRFAWTSQNTSIVTVQPDSISNNTQCVLGIQPPCPQLWGSMKGIAPGTTTVTVQVNRISNDQFIAQYVFPIRITGNAQLTPAPSPSPSSSPVPSTSPTPSPTFAPGLQGDFNGDGKVNLLDYAILIHDLFKTGNGSLQTDLNHDGKVNLLDYHILIGRLST